MSNAILHKSNATTGAIPAAAALTPRELSINTADGRLFTKTDAGAVQEFARQNKGMQFGNAADAGATVLDWYEEGSWTPVVQGTVSDGVGTYSYQEAKFNRIGNLVTVEFRVSWSAHTGTGNIKIAGLPYAQGGLANHISNVSCYNLGALYTNPMLAISTATSTGSLYSNSATGTLASVPMSSGGVVYGAFSYRV